MSELNQVVVGTPEQRQQAMQHAALHIAQQGWQIVAMAGDSLVVSQPGRKPNHVLHFILSLLTAGLWLFVWLLVAIKGPAPDIRKRLTLTPDGQWHWDE